MGKEAAHQCIDENIVSNGKKGITAQSLGNTLHLMVDEGGSGSGVMMVEIGTILDSGSSEIITTTLTSEQREHNKEIFNIVKTAVQSGEITPMISFDILGLYASLVPEIALYLAGSSITMFPMVSGYLTGIILSEAGLGYSELVITSLMLGEMTIYIAPDGTVLLGEGL